MSSDPSTSHDKMTSYKEILTAMGLENGFDMDSLSTLFDDFIKKIKYTGFDTKEVISEFNKKGTTHDLWKIIEITLLKGPAVFSKEENKMKMSEKNCKMVNTIGDRFGFGTKGGILTPARVLLAFPHVTCNIAMTAYFPPYELTDDEAKLPRCIFVQAFPRIIDFQLADSWMLLFLNTYYQMKLSCVINTGFKKDFEKNKEEAFEKVFVYTSVGADSELVGAQRSVISKELYSEHMPIIKKVTGTLCGLYPKGTDSCKGLAKYLKGE